MRFPAYLCSSPSSTPIVLGAPDAYLAVKGLIPMPGAERRRFAHDVNGLGAMQALQ